MCKYEDVPAARAASGESAGSTGSPFELLAVAVPSNVNTAATGARGAVTDAGTSGSATESRAPPAAATGASELGRSTAL